MHTKQHRSPGVFASPAVAAIAVLAISLRLMVASQNGPLVDESFLRQAVHLGNVPYLGGDFRIWPPVAFIGYMLAGILGGRAMAAAFEILSVAVMYGIAKEVLRTNDALSESERAVASLWAAILFLATPTSVYVASLATYDAVASLHMLLAVWLLQISIRLENFSIAFVAGAATVLAFMSRYYVVLFAWVPAGLGLLAFYDRKPILPLAGMLTGFFCLSSIYYSAESGHVFAAVNHGREVVETLSAGTSQLMLLMFALLITFPTGALALVAFLPLSRLRFDGQSKNALLLASALPAVLIYHLLDGHGMGMWRGMIRNMHLPAGLAAPLAGIFLVKLFGCCRLNHERVVAGLGGLIITVGALAAVPLRSWPDWTGVVTVIKSLNISGEIWSSEDQNVWQLRGELGDRVRIDAPWLADSSQGFFEMASSRGVQVIVGAFADRTLKVGGCLDKYLVVARVELENSEPIYVLHRNARDCWGS